ncbi:putative DNA primase [Bacillus phage phiAGATE]|uniref:DNA primase n=1 Tax=Bacillus phage phiAGATE TaxID=1204533 RepID=L0L9C8_9CAUD|nr:DNA primase [Bacillus phage phiAGATE]AGB62773.1 putative DNA primase [Bacillus phage phiAGATE]
MFIDLAKEELGSYKDDGNNLRFNCPFCSETSYKLYIHKELGIMQCWKCGFKGNAISFVKEYYSCDFHEAADILAVYDYDAYERSDYRKSMETYGNDLTEEEKLLMYITREGRPLEEDEENQQLKCPAIPSGMKTLAANMNNPEAYPFLTYLHGRGVTLEQIHEHNISYVVDGMVQQEGKEPMRIMNHVVFFTFDDKRNPLYWNTRAIDKKAYVKSINAPAWDGCHSKATTIFNLNNAKNTDKIVVHEGVFNSFMTPGSGVATFGKQITEIQLDLLINAARERSLPIYLFLDSDAWYNMIETAKQIRSKASDLKVYFVFSGLDEDANDLGIERCSELIANAFLADSEGQMRLQLANM